MLGASATVGLHALETAFPLPPCCSDWQLSLNSPVAVTAQHGQQTGGGRGHTLPPILTSRSSPHPHTSGEGNERRKRGREGKRVAATGTKEKALGGKELEWEEEKRGEAMWGGVTGCQKGK